MAEQYIFSAEAEKIFYEKLDEIHEKYVYHLLLSGLGPKGTDIESIKMTKSPATSTKYCEKVIGGLTNIKPQIISRLVEDRTTRLECMFTDITDQERLLFPRHMFMIQNVMDWPIVENFSCQVWYLGETTLRDIKEIWKK